MDYIPAFGFETSRCNADIKRRDSTTINALQTRNDSEDKKGRFIENLFKVLAYIPIVGTIIGSIRIYGASPWESGEDDEFEQGKKYHHILRGSIEATSLGILLLIPDVILTIHRQCNPHRY